MSAVPHDERPPECAGRGFQAAPGAAGDAPAPPALAEWLEDMRPRLIRLAMRFLWNRHDAEEVAQDALATAWQRIGLLREPSKRNAWLYRITISLSSNRLRRKQPGALPPAETLVAKGEGSSDTEDKLADCVRAAIMRLPERQHAAIVLRDMEDLAYEQIAAILDARPGTVRILVHRAREAVRETILKESPECLEP